MTTAVPSPSLATSRVGLLAAFAVLVGITVVALAPQHWAVVGSLATTEGVPLIAWLLAAYGFGQIINRVLHSEGDTHLAVVTRIAIGLGVISLSTLLLGVVGILHRWSAIFVIVIGCTLSLRDIYNNRNTTIAWLRESPGASWLLLLTAPIVGIGLIGTCILPGVLWGLDDPSGYDVVAYHLQLPREWYELGEITTFDHNVFSFFPLNLEMHSLLAMHLRGGPWAGMYLAQMMHGAFVLLTVVTVYAAARSRGRLAASMAAIACAGVPWMVMLGSVAYVEGGLMLYATLAMAWAIRGRWGLAGACAGLACGCKLTGVPLAVLIAIVSGTHALYVRVRMRAFEISNSKSEISDRGRPVPGAPPQAVEKVGVARFVVVRHLFVFGITALLVFSPWLIRTAIAAQRNPIFPLALHTLGAGHFDAGQIERFEVAHAPRPDQRSINGRLAALWQQVGGDYHYGAIEVGSVRLPLWLLLIVPAIFLVRRDREAWGWLALVVGSIGIWLFATHLQGRFLVQVIPLIAVVVGIAAARSKAFAIASIGVVAITLISMRSPLATLNQSLSLGAIGVELRPESELHPPDVLAAMTQTTRPIVLVGDAKAFWYAIPSARLRYRSVFDVPSAKSFRDAWVGDVPGDALVVVDPGELERLAKTYRHLPALPDEWRDRREPFVVRAADVPK